MIIAMLQPLAGIAIFLFALRLLHRTIDESLAKHLNPFMRYCDQGIALPLFCGFLFTIIFQLSSITVVTAMALASHRLLRIQSAVIVMMGATVGTAVQSLMFSHDMLSIGYFLVVFSGIGTFTLRHPYKRRILEAIFAVGLMFVGWIMIKTGLSPIIESREFTSILISLKGNSFGSLASFFGLCLLITALVQSSSTMILILMGLAQAEHLPLALCISGILGANIGNTFSSLIASWEYRTEIKRIAISHVIIMLIGASTTLFMIPTFINLVDTAFLGQFDHFSIVEQISFTHIAFNITNVIIWLLLLPALLRLTEVLLPLAKGHSNEWLSKSVKLMLSQLPGLALEEVNAQWPHFKKQAKVLEDEVFEILISGCLPQKPFDLEETRSELAIAEELLLDALLKIENQQSNIIAKLTDIRNLKLMLDDLIELRQYLDSLPESEIKTVSQNASGLLSRVDGLRNDIWMAILQDQKMAKSRKTLAYILSLMESNLKEIAQGAGWQDGKQVVLFYNLTARLLGYTQRMLALAGQRKDLSKDVYDLLNQSESLESSTVNLTT